MKKDKKIKKQRKKIKKAGPLKGKTFDLVAVDGGFIPRDQTFPVGEQQFFTEGDLYK